MYKVHHDALLLPVEVNCADYSVNENSMPALSVSASRNVAGEINITVANVDPVNVLNTIVAIDDGKKYKVVRADMITADKMNDYNDFGKDELVTLQSFTGYTQKSNDIQVALPSKSVVLLTLAAK
jgi:alpha-N-arabinofuranosidase